tara:strand:- start:537 stop:797 length:261 start_codon:yes stop_codon:yes gene_type:complete
MNINQLIAIIKKKLEQNIKIEEISIDDKSFLHKNHKSHQEGKFHLKIIIRSDELKKINKIDATKKVYQVLSLEMKENIHSIQVLID